MTEVLAHDALEPAGNVEPTYMLASLCAIVLNSFRAFTAKKGEHPKTIPPSEFIPDWHRKDDPEQSIEEQKAALLEIANAFSKKTLETTKPKTKRRKVK